MIWSFFGLARRAPWGFLGMMVLVASCEGFVTRNHLKFSRVDAEDWRESARIASGELPLGGVFFFGDSQVKVGVSPILLESKLGQPSHCLAVQGGQATSSYYMLKKTLDSGVIPSAVVVDFEAGLLRTGPLHNRRLWPEMLTSAEGLELAWNAGSADLFATVALGEALPSYRARHDIRDNIAAALRGETPPVASWIEMSARNRGMNRGAFAMSTNVKFLENHALQGSGPGDARWAPDPVNDLYARKFLKLCRDRQIPVLCVAMPVQPYLQERYEKSGLEGRYRAWLRGLQETHNNLYVLDWRHSNYRESAFTDSIHMNVDGALSVTAALGDHIAKLFRGEEIGNRWVAMREFGLGGVQIAVEDSSRSDLLMKSTAGLRR